VLVTPGLLPWIKAGDIQPSIKGSDHCPIFVDFHDEIVTDGGEKLVLHDQMHMGVDAAKREPPRLAAKYWPEFQGKQTLMSSFFTKRTTEASAPPTVPPSNELSALATAFDILDTQPPSLSVEEKPPQLSSTSQPETEPSSTPTPLSPALSQASLGPPQESHESRKRSRATNSAATGTSKPKKLKAGQSKLSSFFIKPTTSTTAPRKVPSDRAGSWTTSTSEIIDLCEDSEETSPPSPFPTITSEIRLPAEDSSSSSSSFSQGKENDNNEGSNAGGGVTSWSALFTPIPPPLCTIHGEPAKEFRVNKPGPNKGRKFYLCARPVGPGYDKGRSERLREEVNHQYKCNFFMWSRDARREATHATGATGGGGVAGGRAKS
jgi:AP endonuclease 2